MAQVLKDDVKHAIAAGAVAVFARDGYQGATMASIAKAAGISTGNVYRYFSSKEELFDAVIDASFVSRFLRLLRGQVKSARGHADLGALPKDAPYLVASEELLGFSIEHRLRVVVLLGRAGGSRCQGFAEKVAQELVERAIAHFQELRPGLALAAPARLAVEQAYRSLVATMVLVLATYDDERSIRMAVATYARFHLAGLKTLFEGLYLGQRTGRRS
jgi:AcrR family transcriptional regulator